MAKKFKSPTGSFTAKQCKCKKCSLVHWEKKNSKDVKKKPSKKAVKKKDSFFSFSRDPIARYMVEEG